MLTLNKGTIKLQDGTSTPVVLTALYTMGDLSVSDLNADQQEDVVCETRGVFHALEQGARVYPSGTFSAQMDALTANAIRQFIQQEGTYSSNTSTSPGKYTIDLILETTDGDSMTASDCSCRIALAEGQPSTITVTFTCYGTVVFA